MKKMNLRDLQECELQILLFFDEFCRENGIRYSLASGTMIGAVRHQGFIPWDDDIDIFMRRKEFNKLRRCAAEQGFQVGRYHFCFPGSEGYFYPYLKITDTKTIAKEKIIRPEYMGGVWIDVFPIDYCADTKEEARQVCAVHEQYTEDYFRYFVRCEVNDFRSFLKNIYIHVYRTLLRGNRSKLFRKLNEYAKTPYKPYSGTICWATTKKDTYPSKWFDEYIDCTFEGHTFPVFKDYDKILRHRYGNYMQLPPEDERVAHEPDAYYL